MGRGTAKPAMAVVLAVVVLVCLVIESQPAQAAIYTVGGRPGWTFNTAAWPKGKTFKAGDVLAADSGVRWREEEKHALLDFKLSFTADPLGVLSTWTIHNPDCCEWYGVHCDNRTGHVVSLLAEPALESHQLRPSLLVLQHLTSLSLSANTLTMRIPEFIWNLTKLTHLDLSYCGFFGKIPPQLGNLTRLQTLHLNQDSSLHVDNLQWLSRLSSLQLLDLSGLNLSNATDWLSTLKMLPSLSEFDCPSCSLPNVPPPVSSLCLLNHSTSLQSLDLSYNNISPVTFSCLINDSHNLNTVYLANMNSEQNVPEYLQALVQNGARHSLEVLDISDNNLTRIPLRWTMFPLLRELNISHNQLSEFMVVQDSPGMQKLDISYNLSKFPPLLEKLDASFNRMKGSLRAVLQHLPTNLTSLDLSANSLNDVISDSHLSKFSSLGHLDLSDNSVLTFNFSPSWVPPFQLYTLYLSSCKLGPAFPKWVLTQTSLFILDISNSSISGAIPNAFWNFSTTAFWSLDVSNNKLEGTIPNVSTIMYRAYTRLYLSSNDLHGPIPLFMFSTAILDLSNNKFSSLPHQVPYTSPWIINLSNNLLSGSLPDWIFQFDELEGLNLANNKLSGTIPRDIAPFLQVSALHLNNNRFSGELPSSMKNCTQLLILELANNYFSGSVPVWLGDSLQRLVVLSLRSNNFTGDLPSNLCHLQSLQVLDLSSNRISGSIPGCVDNFTSMTIYQGFNVSVGIASTYQTSIGGFEEYLDYGSVLWKGILANESSRNLPQLNVIDLSNNCLTGEIPSGLTSLRYLRSLNLSRNNLDGSIPDKIGHLKFLEVLELSSNTLGGDIPQSLADVSLLSVLNLSSNNLSGKIPTGTQLQSFDPSSYAGNTELCGEPLPKCPCDKQPFVTDPTEEEEATDETFDFEAFYAALGAGFAFGFWGILGILNFHAPSRHAFFHMATEVGDWIFVKTSLCQSRIKRSSKFDLPRPQKKPLEKRPSRARVAPLTTIL